MLSEGRELRQSENGTTMLYDGLRDVLNDINTKRDRLCALFMSLESWNNLMKNSNVDLLEYP